MRQKDGFSDGSDMSLETHAEYNIIVSDKHKQNFLFDANRRNPRQALQMFQSQILDSLLPHVSPACLPLSGSALNDDFPDFPGLFLHSSLDVAATGKAVMT